MSSWWLADDRAPSLPRVELDRADVEIVGAGITGVSAALTLAEAGLRVRVRDARRVGEGASGRNGGFALRPRWLIDDGAESSARGRRITVVALISAPPSVGEATYASSRACTR
jgi:choline dehydrogenase-like flavoprotein